MSKQSAGIVLYRFGDEPEFFLVHPGGPFWAKKDAGAWSIPKGEFVADDDPLECARREFEEETGSPVTGRFMKLTPVKIRSGKIIHAWAVEGNIDHTRIRSNMCQFEWPPRSGRMIMIPEVDKGGWFKAAEARIKMNAGQLPLIEELLGILQPGT
jgi:predicted NUDIX family NTP pyrophosphohydrolase